MADATDIVQQMADRYPAFTTGLVPTRDDGWGLVGGEVRYGLDYLRYLTPAYHAAPKLRRRVERDVAPGLVRWAQRGPFSRRLLGAALRQIDRALPTDPAIDRFLADARPDVLLVTPLIEPGSPQADYVRSARRIGARTVLCVASWDNLTNKGLIHEPLDLVTVWNHEMKREAVDLHGVSPDRVAVTGAQPFDHWFTWQPGSSRAEFCARVGLDPAEPYVLYVCSSKFVAPQEAPFVRTWIEHLRGSGSEVVRGAGALIRPHPQNAVQWRHFDGAALGNVAVYPPAGAPPVDRATRAEYFDSIFHSAAVVGINTTAEIESAIVGRPVFTVLAPEFRDTQGGTLHFQHLREVNGGLLRVANALPEHVKQLEAALANPGADDERCRRFVEAFVRPHGVDVPATPKLVEALEALGAGSGPRRAPAPPWAPLVRAMVRPTAERLQREAVAEREAKAERDAARAARITAKEVRAAAKERRRQEELAAARTPPSPAPAPSAPEPASPDGRRATRVGDLVAAFDALKEADRATFIKRVAGAIPPLALADAQISQTLPLDFADRSILMRVTSKPERMRLRACAKEPWTVEWLRRTVGAGEVLYDIGANVGAYSLIAARKPEGPSRVVAFEASYANIAGLCANIALNDAAELITPMPVALSDTNGLSVFHLLAMAPGSARHALGVNDLSEGPTVYPQPVLTFRLDDLIELAGLPLPNHIKLDVDGGELAVLNGAVRALSSPALQSMLVEVSVELSAAVTSRLEECGLRLESRIRVQNREGEIRVWYGLFARSSATPAAVSAIGDQLVVR
jgi:FkbM family methyltransferase